MKHLLTLLAVILTSSSYAGSLNAISASAPPPPAPDMAAYAGTRPNKSIFGGYTSINRSIRGGQTPFDRSQIRYYGPATIEKFQGSYYWAIPVTYRSDAPAPHRLYGKPLSDGIHITEARALVSFGKVVQWLYEAPRPVRSSIPVR